MLFRFIRFRKQSFAHPIFCLSFSMCRLAFITPFFENFPQYSTSCDVLRLLFFVECDTFPSLLIKLRMSRSNISPLQIQNNLGDCQCASKIAKQQVFYFRTAQKQLQYGPELHDWEFQPLTAEVVLDHSIPNYAAVDHSVRIFSYSVYDRVTNSINFISFLQLKPNMPLKNCLLWRIQTV